ncbi:MAG: phosphatase PAP2 family protein [Pseudomonadota bacterium]
MIFSAQWLGYLIILWIVWRAFKNKPDFKKIIFLSIGSGVMARYVFVEAIRHFVYSPRPFLILEKVNHLINHESSSSFPSGHTSFYFALAMGIYFINKKAGLWLLISAGLIGFARIYVGVHWPLDIIAGAILGWATAMLIKRIADRIKL